MNDYKNGAQFFSSFKLSFVIIFNSPGTFSFGSYTLYDDLIYIYFFLLYDIIQHLLFTLSLSLSLPVKFISRYKLKKDKYIHGLRLFQRITHVDYFTLLMIMPPCRCIGVELYFSEYFVFVFTNFSSPVLSFLLLIIFVMLPTFLAFFCPFIHYQR